MSVGFWVLFVLFLVLLALAIRRQEDPGPVLKRVLEQGAKLVPRMICALVAAGFVAELLPKQAISQFMGADAGLWAIPVAAGAGLLIPAGPVIAFAIAAVFASAGASTPALIAFVTSWSIFATHRILIYEVPMLGGSFLRLRLLSVLVIPFMAGIIATLVGFITQFGTAIPNI
ncbi:MAG: hypothetical protein COA52_01760 [Hyphomicrobiales bacterium]|nr:hypothetical protein [Hyphomicrobiales bacterium]PCJ96443.1 MAG: hypothetical protein COA52_01760 [Hyphomicrobiales bacterium]